MEKNSVSNFLWIIVTAIIMFALIAIASPFGLFIKNNLETFTGSYIEKTDDSYDEKDLGDITINVSYYKVDGSKRELISSTAKTLKKYEKYSIYSPEIKGYKANIDVVSGIATKDINQVVQYTVASYSIVYVLNDGKWIVPETNIDSSYFYNENVTLPTASHIQRGNYTFEGWYEDSEFKGNPVKSINDCKEPYGNKVFYAKWKGDTFNITYYLNDRQNEYNGKNGAYYYYSEKDDSIATWNDAVLQSNGTLKPQYTQYTYGTEMKLPTSLEKHGYTFLGWSTKPYDPDLNKEDVNGKPKESKRTQITAKDSGNIVLYAQWERNQYSIVYHTDFARPNGKTGIFNPDSSGSYTITHSYSSTPTIVNGYPQSYSYGDSFSLPSGNTLAAEGYTASVWFNTPTKVAIGDMSTDYSLSYTPNKTIHKNSVSPATSGYMDSIDGKKYDHSDLHLYVKAVPNRYTITFDRNCPAGAESLIGDTLTTNAVQRFRYDKTTQLILNPYEIHGYEFIGWNTNPQGTGTSFAQGADIYNLTSVNNGNIVLYAQWKTSNTRITINYFYKNNNGKYPVYPSATEDIYELIGSQLDVTPFVNSKLKDGFTLDYGTTCLVNASNNNVTDIQSFSSDDEKPYTVTVYPSGDNINFSINIYYKKDTYKLTLVTNAPSMVETANAKINGTLYNFAKQSVTVDVPCGAEINLTETHNFTYKFKNWVITNEQGTTNKTSQKLSYAMPTCDTTITLYSQNDTFKIVFHRNFTSLPAIEKSFTLKDASGTEYGYKDCVNGCANNKTNDVLNQHTCSHNTLSGFKFNEPLGKLPKISVSFGEKNHYVFNYWRYTPTEKTQISDTTIIDETFLSKTGVTYNKETKTLHVYAKWSKSTNSDDHEIVTVTKKATCTESGSTITKCSVCGYQKSTVELKPLGHLLGSPVLTQKATCYRGEKYRTTCQRKCGYFQTTRENKVRTAHNSNPQGQCGSTHTVQGWTDICTGSSTSHAWGTCREILCHNASFAKDGRFVDGCGVANSKRLWCGKHGRGTRHTWSCGMPNRIESGLRDKNGNKIRPDGIEYKGKLGW